MTRDSIRALVDAATPGPWENDYTYSALPSGMLGTWVIGPDGDSIGMTNGNAAHGVDAGEDAAFIAASRTAVPLLLAVADAAAALKPGDLSHYAIDGIEYPQGSPEHRVRELRDALAALEATR